MSAPESAGIRVRVLRAVDQILALHKGNAGLLREDGHDALHEDGMRVQARANGGSAQIQREHFVPRAKQTTLFTLHHARVGLKFLSEAHGHRVLQLRAPHLDHAVEFLCLFVKRGNQAVQRL